MPNPSCLNTVSYVHGTGERPRVISTRELENEVFGAAIYGLSIVPYLQDSACSVRRYFGGARKIKTTREKAKNKSIQGRGKITRLSHQSAKRMIWTVSAGSEPTHLITLTYHPSVRPENGKICHEDLRRFFEICELKGKPAFWWLEFQKNESPHFHILVVGQFAGKIRKDGRLINESKILSRKWAKIIGRRVDGENDAIEKMMRVSASIERIRKKGGMISYVSKYAGKMEQKDVPEKYEDVGRFWGYRNKWLEIESEGESTLREELENNASWYWVETIGESGAIVDKHAKLYSLQFAKKPCSDTANDRMATRQ